MKTREILFKNGMRAIHWPDGRMTFYDLHDESWILQKDEVEKLQKYFHDIAKGFEHDYVPGRAS